MPLEWRRDAAQTLAGGRVPRLDGDRHAARISCSNLDSLGARDPRDAAVPGTARDPKSQGRSSATVPAPGRVRSLA